MSVPLVPYDVSFRFGEDLREVPKDAEQMRQALQWCSEQLADGSLADAARAALLGLRGVYARILGELSLAEESLAEALHHCGADERHRTALVLRLATVYQWQGRYAEADRLFEEQMQLCREVPELHAYLDFACQHAGKSSFEQGRYSDAEALLLEAQELRRRKGEAELLASTEHALKQVRMRLVGK